MQEQYSLTVENKSSKTGNICIYKQASQSNENIHALVWLSKKCHPGTCVKFMWSLNYSFIWAENHMASSHAFAKCYEMADADPLEKTKNIIGFTYVDGAFKFETITGDGVLGRFRIQSDASIPLETAYVGIGMAGKPALVMRAQPDSVHEFMLCPKYYVTFGDFEEGEVINLDTIQMAKEIIFPDNVCSLSISFDRENVWSDVIKIT